MVDQALVDFDQEVALHRSETSPVGLRINYLWLMLVPMRTLPPERQMVVTRAVWAGTTVHSENGSIKTHPERSIGAGHRSP